MTISQRRLLAWLGYASFILIGWDTVLVPSLVRSVEAAFRQGDAAFGVMYFLRALAYGAAAFAGGLLLQRAGRVVLPAVCLISAAGVLTSAVAPWWALFVIGGIVMSAGNAVIDTGVNALVLDLFPGSRGGSLNLLHVFFSVGAFAAPLVIGSLVAVGVGWRWLMMLSAVGFLLITPAIYAVGIPKTVHLHEQIDTPKAEVGGRASLAPILGLGVAIACYVGAEIGVASWVVRYLAAQPLTVATGVLSAFWLGLAAGRVAGRWLADRWEHGPFTIVCVTLASLSLAGAVLTPWIGPAAALYAAAGLFYGPVYPMVMAIGGSIYPDRTSALTGTLTMAAAAGGVVYPALMGLTASSIGLRATMMGAALLGAAALAGIVFALRAARVGEPAPAL